MDKTPRTIREIEVYRFKRHLVPRQRAKAEQDRLTESIRLNGLLNPIVATPDPNEEGVCSVN